MATRYRRMRKCEGCGYLLLGDAEHCRHCGAELPRAEAPSLVTTGAPTIAPPPEPLAPVPPPPPPVSPPASPFGGPVSSIPPPLPLPVTGREPVAREGWGDGWAAPVAPVGRAPRRQTPRLLLVLISVVSMAFGWVAVERVLNRDALPSGTSEFVAGHGVPYSSPDRTFDAQFPAQPTIQQKVLSVASASARLNLAQVQTNDYEVVAASMVLPISLPPNQVDAALHDIMREGASATNGEVMSEQPVVVSGVAGLEARVKVPDGYAARLTVLSSGPRIYMLGVHAKHGTDRLYEALVNSLTTH